MVWTATTERFAEVTEGVHDSADALLAAIRQNHTEIAPSVLFAVACILEDTAFINGRHVSSIFCLFSEHPELNTLHI